MSKLSSYIKNTDYSKIIIHYILISLAIQVLGTLSFVFPVLQLCEIMNWNCNLGFIMTFFWSLIFNVLVVTPIFISFLILKKIKA